VVRRVRMTEAERDLAIEFYLAWMPVDTVAVWFDREPATIEALIKRRGVQRGKWVDPNPNYFTRKMRKHRMTLEARGET